MFVYNITKSQETDGIKVKIKGKKDKISHTFITRINYKELEKTNYKNIIKSLLEGLEKKIDLLIVNNIY